MDDMNEIGRRTLLEVERYARGDDGSAQEVFRVNYASALLDAFGSVENVDNVSVDDVYNSVLTTVRRTWPDFVPQPMEGMGPSAGLEQSPAG